MSNRPPESYPSAGAPPLTSKKALALVEKADGAGQATLSSSTKENAAQDASGGRAKANYSDPWLDYIQASSRAELVEKLERDATIRGELRRRIDEMADGTGTSDPGTLEKVDYFRHALAEAEARLKQGSLKALEPLDAFEPEAFAMNGDETEREIRRMLASMDSKAAGMEVDDGLHYPLFSRVHRSLWRQLANGNIRLKPKKR